jgi:hypothetical protein
MVASLAVGAGAQGVRRTTAGPTAAERQAALREELDWLAKFPIHPPVDAAERRAMVIEMLRYAQAYLEQQARDPQGLQRQSFKGSRAVERVRAWMETMDRQDTPDETAFDLMGDEDAALRRLALLATQSVAIRKEASTAQAAVRRAAPRLVESARSDPICARAALNRLAQVGAWAEIYGLMADGEAAVAAAAAEMAVRRQAGDSFTPEERAALAGAVVRSLRADRGAGPSAGMLVAGLVERARRAGVLLDAVTALTASDADEPALRKAIAMLHLTERQQLMIAAAGQTSGAMAARLERLIPGSQTPQRSELDQALASSSPSMRRGAAVLAARSRLAPGDAMLSKLAAMPEMSEPAVRAAVRTAVWRLGPRQLEELEVRAVLGREPKATAEAVMLLTLAGEARPDDAGAATRTAIRPAGAAGEPAPSTAVGGTDVLEWKTPGVGAGWSSRGLLTGFADWVGPAVVAGTVVAGYLVGRGRGEEGEE